MTTVAYSVIPASSVVYAYAPDFSLDGYMVFDYAIPDYILSSGWSAVASSPVVWS